MPARVRSGGRARQNPQVGSTRALRVDDRACARAEVPFARGRRSRQTPALVIDTLRARTSDPARYLDYHIARDLLLADYYRATVAQTGLRASAIDGTQDATTIAALVEAHFGLGAW